MASPADAVTRQLEARSRQVPMQPSMAQHTAMVPLAAAAAGRWLQRWQQQSKMLWAAAQCNHDQHMASQPLPPTCSVMREMTRVTGRPMSTAGWKVSNLMYLQGRAHLSEKMTLFCWLGPS